MYQELEKRIGIQRNKHKSIKSINKKNGPKGYVGDYQNIDA